MATSDSEDTRPNSMRLAPVTPIEAVHQGLNELQVAHSHLDRALEAQDAFGAEIAARCLALSLLVARTVLQRLGRSDGPEIGALHVALVAAHRGVIDHYARADDRLNAPSLLIALRRLRHGLALAFGGEPPLRQ